MAKAPARIVPDDEPTSFEDILNQRVDETERPKPLPQGSYLCIVQGLPRYDKSSKKQTPFAEFTLKPMQALEDVDEDALEEMGGLGNKTLRYTFYLTPNAMWRLREFIEHCGADVDQSYDEAIAKIPNSEVIATVVHTPSEDGTAIFANIKSTAPAN